MKVRGLLPATIVGFHCLAAFGQVTFTGVYEENFDALGTTGTEYPAGWSGTRHAGSGAVGAVLSLGTSTGTATSGGVYNVGTAGDTDRALGVLSSAATVPCFGVQLRNGTGSSIDELSLSAVLEQWRSGSSAAVNETLAFEYSLNAAGVYDPLALWTRASAFDLPEIRTSTTSAGALNGDLPENQLFLSGTLEGVQWLDQGVLTLRWLDTDDTGSDGMYAVDNFRLSGVSTVPEPGGLSLCALGAAAIGLLRRRWKTPAPTAHCDV